KLMKQNKLAVVGVGHVGSYVLADAMKTNLFSEIVVIDKNHDVARGEALDQAHATALTCMNNTDVYAGDYQDVADVDVIIITSEANDMEKDNNTKSDRELRTVGNPKVIRAVMEGITTYTKEAIIMLITYPLDTITYISGNELGYPKGRLFGTGT